VNAKDPVGIAGIGTYLPDTYMTAEELSRRSGLPLAVVTEKMGISRKPIPGPDDHTCEMGIRAAREAMAAAGTAPEEIDLVVYIGEEHKEYPVWTAALRLQEAVGARGAWGFDMSLRCSTALAGIKIAKHMIASDPGIRTVLLAGGYRNVDLIDYANPRTRFMYNLAAGGGAVVLRGGLRRNVLLETCVITDGSFSEDVVVPAGGTKLPLTADALDRRLHCLDVPDPEGMKERLERKSMDNFLQAVRASLSASGYAERDIAYLGLLHMKRSAHEHVLKELGLRDEQSIYLHEYGHVGQFDPILSLQLAEREGRLKDGDVVVLVSAGIGYAWSATTILWGDSA